MCVPLGSYTGGEHKRTNIENTQRTALGKRREYDQNLNKTFALQFCAEIFVAGPNCARERAKFGKLFRGKFLAKKLT